VGLYFEQSLSISGSTAKAWPSQHLRPKNQVSPFYTTAPEGGQIQCRDKPSKVEIRQTSGNSVRKARRSRHVEQAGDVAQGHEDKGEDNKFLRGQCHLVGLEGDQSVGLFEKNSQQLGNHQIRNFNQVLQTIQSVSWVGSVSLGSGRVGHLRTASSNLLIMSAHSITIV